MQPTLNTITPTAASGAGLAERVASVGSISGVVSLTEKLLFFLIYHTNVVHLL